MKRFIAILTGITLLFTATPTFAKTPVSEHYTQKVLERADAGMEYIATDNKAWEDTIFLFSFLHLLDSVGTALLFLVDTDLRIEEQAKDLLRRTPCLHYDLYLIEQKMEEARQALNKAFEEKKGSQIYQYQALLRFLNERYRALIRGATDPSYEDLKWGQRQVFDPIDPVWCCISPSLWVDENDRAKEEMEEGKCIEKPSEATCLRQGGRAKAFSKDRADECVNWECEVEDEKDIEESKRACPFHSNYLPPTSKGYGCQAKVLEDLLKEDANLESLEAESEALSDLTAQRSEFFALIRTLSQAGEEISSTISRFSGKEPAKGGAVDDPPGVMPRKVFGCETLEEDEEDEGGKGDLEKAIDFLHTLVGPLRWVRLPDGAIRSEFRGPFSFKKDEIRILSEFFTMRRRWGTMREQADYLKFPDEFKTDEEREKWKLKESPISFIRWVLQWYGRRYFEGFNRDQAGLESVGVSRSVDAAARMEKAMMPVRKAMASFTENAVSPDNGLRSFVTRFAFFLRRSCIFRPCNERLELILKLNYSDSCFPYTNYQGEGYEACKQASELDIEP